jgi:hypothetical protein
MKFSDNEQTLATLIKELEEAIESREVALTVQDGNCVEMWDLEIDILSEKIRNLGL